MGPNNALNRVLVFGLFSIILLFAVVQGARYFLSFKTITLQPKNDVSISIGSTAHDGTIEKIILETSGQESIRVRRGQYSVLYHGKDINSRVEVIKVTRSMTLGVPSDLSFTNKKLDAILGSQTEAINKTLSSIVDLGEYSISYKKLYLDGSWGGFGLTPTDANKDTVSIILHRLDNSWGVVAGPDIVIAQSDHPEVPATIISSVNNRL